MLWPKLWCLQPGRNGIGFNYMTICCQETWLLVIAHWSFGKLDGSPSSSVAFSLNKYPFVLQFPWLISAMLQQVFPLSRSEEPVPVGRPAQSQLIDNLAFQGKIKAIWKKQQEKKQKKSIYFIIPLFVFYFFIHFLNSFTDLFILMIHLSDLNMLQVVWIKKRLCLVLIAISTC